MSESNSKEKVTVLGVGTGGSRIAAELAATSSANRLKIVLVDTDEKALSNFSNHEQLLIGSDWTDKQGCGGDMSRGEKASGASSQALSDIIVNTELLIVVSPLGGGTGSGTVPFIATIARRLKVLSLFFVTRPFSFEGNLRFKNADKSLKSLTKTADAVICLENDILFKNLSGNINSDFKEADKTLAECVGGISEMLFTEGLITIDFTHIKQMLKKRDADCHIGIGRAIGENKNEAAIKDLLECPTLGGSETLENCNTAIVTLLAGPDLNMNDINSCISHIKELFTEDCEVNVGVATSSDRENYLQLTLLTIKDRKKDAQQEDLFGPAPKKTTRRKPPKKEKKEATVYNIQGELPLQELTSGIFENSTPTMHNGQNLDIPTYLRQGLTLDIGE
ncbi:MAG: cell division FtsZ family protein [Lentisphaerales bacterium]|nr:cell division FtsZ family protein [Lentisphaerales bacterium]